MDKVSTFFAGIFVGAFLILGVVFMTTAVHQNAQYQAALKQLEEHASCTCKTRSALPPCCQN